MNRVILKGNVIRDTEIRYTNSGKAVTTINLAVSNDYKKDGEWVKNPCFVDVVVWKEKVYAKGTPIIVEGKLNMRQWEQDGRPRQKLEIQANSVYEIKKEVKEEAPF